MRLKRAVVAAAALLWCVVAAAATGTPADDWATRPASREYGAANGCTDGGKLCVHLVPHSHDDVGWKLTAQQYFWGTKRLGLEVSDLVSVSVVNTLDAVVMSLGESADRRFTQVESYFLSHWWDQASDRRRAAAKELCAGGQLGLANGGWVMHDEACTHFVDQITQTTLGHRFLNASLGAVPSVGWQIDPFGHSATNAAFSAEYGFSGQFFARLDYQEKHQRLANKSMQWLWTQQDRQDATTLFTHAMFDGYSAPAPFTWDVPLLQQLLVDNIVDDARSPEYNLPAVMEALEAVARRYAANYTSRHVLVPCGSDFEYQAAEPWFKNLDKLIHYANSKGVVQARYSTPMEYLEAVVRGSGGCVPGTAVRFVLTLVAAVHLRTARGKLDVAHTPV